MTAKNCTTCGHNAANPTMCPHAKPCLFDGEKYSHWIPVQTVNAPWGGWCCPVCGRHWTDHSDDCVHVVPPNTAEDLYKRSLLDHARTIADANEKIDKERARAAALEAALSAMTQRAEEAERELRCIRGWIEEDWALDLADRPTARAVVRMYKKLNDDARSAEARIATLEAQVEAAALDERAKVIARLEWSLAYIERNDDQWSRTKASTVRAAIRAIRGGSVIPGAEGGDDA